MKEKIIIINFLRFPKIELNNDNGQNKSIFIKNKNKNCSKLIIKGKKLHIYLIEKIILIINLIISISPKQIIDPYRKLNLIFSDIIIKINLSGNQTIINRDFYSMPTEVLVNDVSSNLINNNQVNLNKSNNTIIMRWDSLLNSTKSMFDHVYNIIEVDLSYFNSSKVTTMEKMFLDCIDLQKVKINGYFNTSSVNNMKFMFFNCTSLTSLDLSYLDTSLVTNFEYFFSESNKLISLDLSNFNISSALSMKFMFSGCLSLNSLIFSNSKTSQVKDIESMFASCTSLISLDLSNFDISKLTNINSIFENCYSLKSLSMPKIQSTSIIDMHRMFFNCVALTSLDLSYFNTVNVVNMVSMFELCSNLYYLNIGNFFVNSSLNITNMFKRTSESLVYCINDQINADMIESVLIGKNCSIKDCSNNWKNNLFKDEKNNISIFYDKCVHNIIKHVSEDFFLSNNIPNVSIYSYILDSNIEELKDKYTNVSFIDFTKEDIEFLMNVFNLNKNINSIYTLISDLPSNDPRKATSDYIFKLLLENGTELNLSLINQDFYVNISIPIRNLDLANFNYSLYFNEQGYDIYNKNSNFYSDICTSAYYYNSDIILNDRKKNIYPNNVTLCDDNCIYKMIDIDDKRITCECNIINNNNDNDIEDNFLSKNDDDFLSYLLDNINYKIFVCANLLFSFKNLKTNIAFYLILSSFLILSFFNFKFLFSGLSKLRIEMFKLIPTNKRVKNTIKEQLSKRNDIFKEHSSRINYFLKNKKSKNKKNHKLKYSRNNEKYYLNFFQTNINFNINKKNLKKILILLKKENKTNNDKKNNDKYNELPYTRAIIEDNRNIHQLFISFLLKKIELINIFINGQTIKDLLICEYILSLLIDFFFNTLFYSDDLISKKYHNNGKLDFTISIIVALISNITTSIIRYFYLNNSNLLEEKIENILEIKRENKFLNLLIRFFKYVKLRMIFFILSEFVILFACFYYIIIYCIIYNKTQISLITNYLTSLLEGFAKSLIVTIIIVITRKIGISFLNVYIYNASKYIDSKF